MFYLLKIVFADNILLGYCMLQLDPYNKLNTMYVLLTMLIYYDGDYLLMTAHAYNSSLVAYHLASFG